MKPLAERLKIKSIDELIGQEHLTSILRKMIEKNQVFSLIIYGKPGSGKTSLASILASQFMNSHFFNASTDEKAKLKDYISKKFFDQPTFLVIDEIHRMKKDTQDYLLPFTETGELIICGLTTENPTYSINPALKSRTMVLEIKDLSPKEILEGLERAIKNPLFTYTGKIDDEVLNYLAVLSYNDLRKAYNMLDVLTTIYDEHITLEKAQKVFLKANLPLDDKSESYYDILSALQKAIRGSHVNASLHYLARLITLGDLEIIIRRLMVICYEDIGLANPNLQSRVYIACQTALKLGLPEAMHPLSAITVEMALSPKSNSAYLALGEALADIEKGNFSAIPKNILNREVKNKNANYLYPHDYPNALVFQEYMPEKIKDRKYYQPKSTSSYESALKERDQLLDDFFKNS
ncbi:MAG: AAA family ATPase [Erysipelotrichales bacterium]|nr:AAA family ATPase [Erysipelotrichales bacterium]